jgi:fatty acid-binding protein DegV
LGRAGGLLGNHAQVKPILHVDDGKIEVLCNVRTKSRAVDTMLDVLKTAAEAGEVSEISVLHVDSEAVSRGSA